mmetsp:Transcript_6071/g.3426  ORF Transcript_6071/g.3426 Transcript_6071/m.3426 type:complete len:99 (-) Transcript_6071:126-422(-)
MIISREAIHALTLALKDRFEGVRETAASALGVIGTPESIEATDALIESLKDQSSQVRAMSAWALGRLGTHARNAAPLLTRLLKDGYWKVRTAACEALG